MGYSEDFIPDGMNAFERNVKRIGDCIVAQLLSADGARQRPIAIIIGPVTTGGKNFITFLTPTNFISNAKTKYNSPAQATPKHAYGSIWAESFTPKSPKAPDTVVYPPRNAKDEPRNAGTCNFVKIWKRIVPRPAISNVV